MRKNTVRGYIDRERILERDGYICVYCQRDADTVDHIIPWDWSHDDSDSNLVSSCGFCNGIAHDKIFDSLAAKYAYIRKVRETRRFKRKLELELQKVSKCVTCHKPYKPRNDGATIFLCRECEKLTVGEHPKMPLFAPQIAFKAS